MGQNLVFLFLKLEADQNSGNAELFLTSDLNELLDSLKPELGILKRHKSQVTSLFRALLELSGGKVNCQQHNFTDDYTANENCDLYASILGIKTPNKFGKFDALEMRGILLKSLLVGGMTLKSEDLESWTTKMECVDFLEQTARSS